MKTVSLTMLHRDMNEIITTARGGETVAVTSHGKTVAYIVKSLTEYSEMRADKAAAQAAREEARRYGTLPLEKVIPAKAWKKAQKRAAQG